MIVSYHVRVKEVSNRTTYWNDIEPFKMECEEHDFAHYIHLLSCNQTLWEIRYNVLGNSQGHYVVCQGRKSFRESQEKAVVFSETFTEMQIRVASQDAHKKYSEHYDQFAYERATVGKGAAYCNRLIDYALAVCGSPYHSLPTTFSNLKLNRDAKYFLSKFIK